MAKPKGSGKAKNFDQPVSLTLICEAHERDRWRAFANEHHSTLSNIMREAMANFLKHENLE